jgi:hypothetical protein
MEQEGSIKAPAMARATDLWVRVMVDVGIFPYARRREPRMYGLGEQAASPIRKFLSRGFLA